MQATGKNETWNQLDESSIAKGLRSLFALLDVEAVNDELYSKASDDPSVCIYSHPAGVCESYLDVAMA